MEIGFMSLRLVPIAILQVDEAPNPDKSDSMASVFWLCFGSFRSPSSASVPLSAFCEANSCELALAAEGVGHTPGTLWQNDWISEGG